jgi:hypothetical protein
MPAQFPVPPTSKRTGQRHAGRFVSQSVEAFRACHERYNACLDYQSLRTKSHLNETVGSYLLDFDLAAKRAIGADNDRYRLFQLYFLQGRSAAEVGEQLGIARFTVAKEVGEIEKLAGEAFVQRGLFPLSSYFREERSPISERRAA